MKNKSRSKSKRHRSLRKKSGGGWFDSKPSDPADDALPWHKKIAKSLTSLFSSASAPPLPENVAPPPRPGQQTAPVEQVKPPGQQQIAPAAEQQIAPAAAPIPGPGQQIAPAAAAMQPSSSPQFPTPENQFSSSTAFGGKRTKKRRNHKKK